MKNKNVLSQFWLILVASTLAACSGLIAAYSQTAYEQATSIKAESLVIMNHATEPYSQHAREVADLMLSVDKAYEYAKGRPKNEISTEQWAKMKDPNSNLLGGFIKRWKEQGQLSAVFVKEAEAQIAKAFDQIIELESGKSKERK